MKKLFSLKHRSLTALCRNIAFATTLLTLISNGTAHAQANAVSKPLHFMVFGDWGTGNAQQKAVAEAMARYAQMSKTHNPVQFVISTGDNFYENGVSSVDDPQWETKCKRTDDKWAVRQKAVYAAAMAEKHGHKFQQAAE